MSSEYQEKSLLSLRYTEIQAIQEHYGRGIIFFHLGVGAVLLFALKLVMAS